ncbi:serine/threonine protein kinase [Nonomuraea sp. PA05]|uniref:serine/threonine protein kinase n=1 Tax=Nonomuraea sp. PA05 TaxID=2604466 RepID=UPI001CA32869|nr:serine/threonine-protein kinase [Nonomuraea sp. PA05]
MKPLIANDPAQVGGHRIVGRLGVGGQGVVYLGELPDGTRVAIKMLGDGLDDPEARVRFRQEIEYARRVKAFCTAQVLASGEFGDTPYVVSEYVDGPALADVILERGPLRGAELRRLAIGTLTALAAIHQAGVVHRDFKPGNVLLSRDGPRVIDFGISRAAEEGEVTGQHIVGTPPYMAPEQFEGGRVGPAADLFAWGATMVAAGTGRPPFGTGELPPLVARILHGEPELGDLREQDGELCELAVRCLAKDPQARPTATRALLTLLGHRVPEEVLRGTGEQRLLAEGQQSAAPPGHGGKRGRDEGPVARSGREGEPGRGTGPVAWVGRGRRPLVVAGAVVTAVAVTAAVLLLRPAPVPEPSAPAPLPTPSAGSMALTSASEVKIAGSGIVVHENAADPAWVSSYIDSRDNAEAYVRDPATKAFAYFGNFERPAVSPGGRFVASLSPTRTRRPDFETIRIRDRATGRDGELRTVNKPHMLDHPVWSADGRLLLATVLGAESGAGAVGFAVVDPVAGSVKVVETESADKAVYKWGSDEKSVLQQARDGSVRVLGLNGAVLRTFSEVGALAAGGAAETTLGSVFNTKCPDNARNICFWDEGTGAKKGEARLPDGAQFHGWLDDSHLLATVAGARTTDVIMTDATGKPVRTLISGPRKEVDKITFWFSVK